MGMKQLDVVLVPVPFSDQSATKVRPALVVSGTRYELGDDVVVCAITSNTARTNEPSFLITQSDFAAGGLPVPSVVRVAYPTRIQRCIVRKTLGTLKAKNLQTVRNEFTKLLA